MWENTLLFFSNDNGREGGANERGGKNDFWQGGILGHGFFSGPAIHESKRGSTIRSRFYDSQFPENSRFLEKPKKVI